MGKNKKVIGMFKNECKGMQISEFVGLWSKLYAFIMVEGEDEKKDKNIEKKKCKGIRKPVIEKDISFDDYKRCLFTGSEQMRKEGLLSEQSLL